MSLIEDRYGVLGLAKSTAASPQRDAEMPLLVFNTTSKHIRTACANSPHLGSGEYWRMENGEWERHKERKRRGKVVWGPHCPRPKECCITEPRQRGALITPRLAVSSTIPVYCLDHVLRLATDDLSNQKHPTQDKRSERRRPSRQVRHSTKWRRLARFIKLVAIAAGRGAHHQPKRNATKSTWRQRRKISTHRLLFSVQSEGSLGGNVGLEKVLA